MLQHAAKPLQRLAIALAYVRDLHVVGIQFLDALLHQGVEHEAQGAHVQPLDVLEYALHAGKVGRGCIGGKAQHVLVGNHALVAGIDGHSPQICGHCALHEGPPDTAAFGAQGINLDELAHYPLARNVGLIPQGIDVPVLRKVLVVEVHVRDVPLLLRAQSQGMALLVVDDLHVVGHLPCGLRQAAVGARLHREEGLPERTQQAYLVVEGHVEADGVIDVGPLSRGCGAALTEVAAHDYLVVGTEGRYGVYQGLVLRSRRLLDVGLLRIGVESDTLYRSRQIALKVLLIRQDVVAIESDGRGVDGLGAMEEWPGRQFGNEEASHQVVYRLFAAFVQLGVRRLYVQTPLTRRECVVDAVLCAPCTVVVHGLIQVRQQLTLLGTEREGHVHGERKAGV